MCFTRTIIALFSTVLLLTSCAEQVGNKVADALVPPSKPSPEVVDPYKKEADLLKADLNGIRFLLDLGEEKDKEIFLKSSQNLRERMAIDPLLKNRLSSKMPADVWLNVDVPNYNFANFDSDVIQPLISIGSFATSDDLIRFIDTFPERSLPQISGRIEKLNTLNEASLGKGKYKLNIYVGGNSISKAIRALDRVEGVLNSFSESELAKIGSVTLGFTDKVDVRGNKLAFQLNENSSAGEWFTYIKTNLSESI